MLKDKHLTLVCLCFIRHMKVSQRFENEYADVSHVQIFSDKLYINVFMLSTTLRVFSI